MTNRATSDDGKRVDSVSTGDTTLLLAGIDDDERAACTELMETDRPSNQLLVTYTQTADGRFRDWRRNHSQQAADMNIVAVGDLTRSAQAGGGGGGSSLPPITGVENPADLTGIGMKVTRRLESWADTKAPITVCFDSVSVLLQHVDPRRAYQFLHVLTTKLQSAGAIGHIHMDPDKHDQQIVDQVASLCDALVEVDGDEWSVRSRR